MPNTNNYLSVIYGNYAKSNYPKKLACHIHEKYFKSSGRLLDLGCGDGTYARLFAELSYTTNGYDDVNSTNLPFLTETYDYIFCKSVIEHVRDLNVFLSEVFRVLKKDGKLLILTPAWEYNYKDFYNDPTHIRPFHRKGLQDALKLAGFRNVKVEYFYHLPFMWERNYLWFIPKLLSLFSKYKWKDKEETKHRVLLRFSQEVQLLAIASK